MVPWEQGTKNENTNYLRIQPVNCPRQQPRSEIPEHLASCSPVQICLGKNYVTDSICRQVPISSGTSHYFSQISLIQMSPTLIFFTAQSLVFSRPYVRQFMLSEPTPTLRCWFTPQGKMCVVGLIYVSQNPPANRSNYLELHQVRWDQKWWSFAGVLGDFFVIPMFSTNNVFSKKT